LQLNKIVIVERTRSKNTLQYCIFFPRACLYLRFMRGRVATRVRGNWHGCFRKTEKGHKKR